MSDTLEFIHPQLRALALTIDDLNEDPANANKHNEGSLAGIAKSFLKFGQRKPVVVRREGMIVEAGNGTLAALRHAGWTHLACVVCDDSEAMAKAYALADNRTAQLATWDYTQLATNVQELLDDGFDCASLGWAEDDLQGLLEGEWTTQNDFGEQGEEDGDKPPAPDDGDPNDDTPPPEEPPIPELPAEPVTKLGEVIQLGPHTLHCADCMVVMAGIADNSVDAIVTDPPYGLSPDGVARTWDDIEALRAEGKSGPSGGMMGKAWDAGVPGITWARECLRVLKPGGHMIAASATRTVHRLTCAVEDAGFEIRDQIGWLYWTGMSKTMDLSAAIDKQKDNRAHVLALTKWIASARDAAGVSNKDIDDAFGFAGMAGHWTTQKSQPSVPTIEQFPTLLAVLQIEEPPEEIRTLMLDLNAAKGEPGPNWWKREVTGHHATPAQAQTWSEAYGGSPANEAREIRAEPVSEAAVQWSGWGTSLKPAIEPFVLARKPLSECTVVRNVLKWGTGAINIDAARHADEDPAWPGPWSSPDPKFPANIYYCPKPSTREREAGCEDLDRRHETVKPRALMAQFLRLVTPPGGVVLEPFGGSGTTAVAAAGLACSVVIAEREPGYCDIIRARVNHSLLPPERRKPPRAGDKVQARRRVQTLIDNGAIKAPGEVPCFDCGDETCESPHEYDHYLGYGVDHHEDVQAVCAVCHHKREAERVAQGTAP